MSRKSRHRAGLASSFAAVAAAATIGLLTAGSAAAVDTGTTVPDPQTTNVPYLAWAGEQIRLVKCFDAPAVDASNASAFDFSRVRAEFLVEDWSGDSSSKPQVEDPTVKLFFSRSRDQVCAQGDAISLDPGMARIELDVTDDAGVLGVLGGGPAQPVVKHQFLAGWMTINRPSLRELAASDFARSATAAATNVLGDPAGDGHFVAGAKPGILGVNVTGSMPMNAKWAALVGASTVTLPNDWSTLATALATDANPADANPAMRWDIHDNETDVEGHVLGSACGGGTLTAQDAVDNCLGGGPDGPFSRVFGDLSAAGTSVGPFDPLRANETLLSNGTLDAGDAPMPAARIDVSIAPNSGGPADIGGIGSLAPQSKAQSYSRDFTGNPTPHNLYAPFYSAYLPATAAPNDAASGIDGPATGNDFTGFLNADPQYRFWNIAYTFATNAGGATNCLRSSRDPQTATPMTNRGDFYQLPSGASSVAVYTDEHGEAQVRYVPGTGFYFNSLIQNGGAILNANGGCDLQNVGLLGTADISAVARYPYKPVDYPAMASNAVHKDVKSLWSKTLSYFPKGSGSANANARIVVAHAQDITGAPFADEVVCFSSDAESMTWFNGTIHGINLSGTGLARDPKGGHRLCVRTDANGNAAVEVLESNSVHVNVIADFANEGILRSIDVDFTTPGSTVANPGPSTTPGAPGTTTPSPSLIKKITPGLGPSGSNHSNVARVTFSRLVKRAHGHSYITVRVASRAGHVTIQLRLTLVTVSRHRDHAGRIHLSRIVRHRTITRTVSANRLVRITLPATVSAAKVVILH
jgi:hypothetical protein